MKSFHFVSCLLVALAIQFLALPAFCFTPPLKHEWRVSLPSNMPYDICTVVFYADNGNVKSGQMTVSRGNNVRWSSVKPLSNVIGWCGAAGYALQPRTCTGIDSANGNVSHASCGYDISVKVCPKKANANQYNSLSYGFCQD